MPWVEFTRTFLWKPVRVQGILYNKGNSAILVTTPCAEKAIAIGAAVRVDRPRDIKKIPYGNQNKKSRQAKPKA